MLFCFVFISWIGINLMCLFCNVFMLRLFFLLSVSMVGVILIVVWDIRFNLIFVFIFVGMVCCGLLILILMVKVLVVGDESFEI